MNKYGYVISIIAMGITGGLANQAVWALCIAGMFYLLVLLAYEM